MLFRNVLHVVRTSVGFFICESKSRLNFTNQFSSRLSAVLLTLPLFAIPGIALSSTHHAGATLGSFDVGQSGAASYSIPLQVPPGIAGMQPKLSLEYNSQSGNGLLGVGWSLGGLSSVTRCPTTLDQDGFIDGVDFDSNDRFCLDGQRLVNISGNEFRTEIESYSKITSTGSAENPDSFVVKTKSGQTLTYGTTDARIEANGSNAGKVMSWALKTSEDTAGNQVNYNYASNVANGSFHLDFIDYASARIQFEYEDRPAQLVSYQAGSQFSAIKRLSAIHTSVAGVAIKEYNLTYQQSTATGRSKLANLNECDVNLSSPRCKLTSEFSSSDFQKNKFSMNYNVAGKDGSYVLWTPSIADFSGDGLDDILWDFQETDGRSAGKRILWIRKEDGTYSITPNVAGQDGYYKNWVSSIADFDGDGLADILWDEKDIYNRSVGNRALWFSNGNGTFTIKYNVAGKNGGYQLWAPLIADFNGDGLADILWDFRDTDGRSAGKRILWIGKGDGTFAITYNVAGQDGYYKNWVSSIADFNGDGLADIFWDDQDVNKRSVGNRALWFGNGDGTFTIKYNVADQNGSYKLWAPSIADFNGDGLADILWDYRDTYGRSAGNRILWTGKGDGTFAITYNVAGQDGIYKQWASSFADFNGDGLADILWNEEDQYGRSVGNRALWFSNGDGTFTIKYNVAGKNGSYKLWAPSIADFNGDGLADVLWDYRDIYGRSAGKRIIWINSGAITPDLVTSVTNGLGERFEVSYKPITNSVAYQKGSGAEYPVQDIQSPMYVVSSYTKSDGLRGQYKHSYFYEGAKAHLRGRGFLGFRKISVTDNQTGLKKETVFNQDFPTAGRIETLQSLKPDGTVLSSTTNTWVETSTPQDAVKVVQLASTDEVSNELDGTPITRVITTNQYNTYGDVTQIVIDSTDGYKKTTTNTYDPPNTVDWILGRLTRAEVKSEKPGGQFAERSSEFTYYANGLLHTEVVEPGNQNLELTTTYEYDSYGNRNKISVSGHPGAVAPYAIAPRTTLINYDYSNLGDTTNPRIIVNTTNAKLHTETKVIDARFGGVKSLTGPNNRTTTWQYDSLGRKIREDRADGTWSSIDYQICETGSTCSDSLQQSLGSPLAIVTRSSTGAVGSLYFDPLGRECMKTSKNFSGQTVHVKTLYDTLGRVAQVSAPDFSATPQSWTSYSYDELGRMLTETNPDGSITSVAYYGLKTVTTNDKNQTVTKIKNSQGKLVTSNDAANNSNSYEYDAFGNLTKVTDAVGNATTMSYDIRGKKIAMNDPDMGAWEYKHNALGELVWQKDAQANVVNMQYDVLGRMIERVEKEGTSTWTYDTATHAVGKLAQVIGPNGYQRSHRYDPLGRPDRTVTVIGGTSLSVNTTYDNQSRPLTATYPSGVSIKNVYNANGYLAEIRDAANNALYWQGTAVNARGQFKYEKLGNGVDTEHAYNELTGRLERISTMRGATAVDDIQRLEFKWDTLGNLMERSDANQGLVERFAYDDLNRLLQAELVGIDTRTYQYDSIGNITYKSDVGDYTYGQNGAGPHAVTTAGPATYQYDANGNQIGQLGPNGRALSYTSYNKPLTASKGTTTVTYYYDADHNRIRKVRNKDGSTSSTLYLGKSYEQINWATGVTEHKHYLATKNTTILIIKRSTGSNDTRYLHKDHLGSTSVITKEDGSIAEKLSFDAWGSRRNLNWTNTLDMIGNPLLIASLTTRGFTGHEHDDGIGLINMNARMYDPILGRFLQADTYVQFPESTQGFNRYTYVNNNPLSFTDPSGHFIKAIFKAVTKLVKKIVDNVRSVVKKYGKVIVAAAAAYLTAGAAAPWVMSMSWAAAGGSMSVATYSFAVVASEVVAGMAGGFVSGAIIGGNMKSALMGAAGGAAFGLARGISQVYQLNSAAKIALDGTANGAVNEIQGKDFASGFATGAFKSYIGGPAGEKGSMASSFSAAAKRALDVAGKVWALPNTIVGFVAGLAGIPFGAELKFTNNAFWFKNYPWGNGAITIGNTVMSTSEWGPDATRLAYGVIQPIGPHEQAHTYQYQALGPLFAPVYFLSGGAFTDKSPFETAASRYATTKKGWWPF